MEQPLIAGVSLLEKDGPVYDVGRPRLLCWFSAVQMPGTSLGGARVVLIARSSATDAWEEYARDLAPEQVADVVGGLKGLGLPASVPEVWGAPDTSDVVGQTTVRVWLGDDATSFEFSWQCSGLRGAHAGQFADLCGYLFGLAGYRDRHPYAAPDEFATFCTRCGGRVAPYRSRSWAGDFPDDYDVPLAEGDPARDGEGAYRCPSCAARWRAFDRQDTGADRRCGHFLPAYVRFCGYCGSGDL